MSRNKVIAYSDASGNCRVVIPTMDCPLSDDAVIVEAPSGFEPGCVFKSTSALLGHLPKVDTLQSPSIWRIVTTMHI